MDNRIFTSIDKNDKEIELEFRRPPVGVSMKAEQIFKKEFAIAMRDGLLLQAEVEKQLEDRGLWGPEQEEKEKQLRSEIERLEALLNDDMGEDEGKRVCEEITKLRDEISKLTDVVTTMASSTCEAQAAQERNQYLAAQCVYHKKTGIKVYNSLDDYKARVDETTALDSYRETLIAILEMSIGKELPSDLTTEYGENKWLSKFETKVIDKVEPEVKPKKTRKRKTAEKSE